MILLKVIFPSPIRMLSYCGLASVLLAIPCMILLYLSKEVNSVIPVVGMLVFGIFPRVFLDNYVDQNNRTVILRKDSLAYHDQQGKMVEIPRRAVVNHRLERHPLALSQELIVQSDSGAHTLNLLLYRKREADLILGFFQHPTEQWTAFFSAWLEKEQRA